MNDYSHRQAESPECGLSLRCARYRDDGSALATQAAGLGFRFQARSEYYNQFFQERGADQAVRQAQANLVLHRHLNHQRLTLAAIDDVISRGKWNDWAELRRAALNDREVMAKIQRVCDHYADDPYRQRYRFWANYVEAHG